MVNAFKRFFNQGGQRSLAVKQHVLYSAFFKGGSLLINLILVPIYLGLLDTSLYGVWLALSSIVTWFQFFDLGLGNGLRNKLVEAKEGIQEYTESQLVSSAYAMVCLPALLLIAGFSVLPFFLDIGKLLRIESQVSNDLLALTLMWLGLSFGVQLVLKTITYIYLADQKASMNNAVNFSMNILLLLALYGFDYFDFQPSVAHIAFLNGLFPVLILLILTLYAFNGPFNHIKLSLRNVSFNSIRAVLVLGGQFFIIQISAVVLFSTDNIIASYLFDDSSVSQYAIHYKLFQFPLIAFSILMQPFWSAFTQAKVQQDWVWVQNAIRKLLKLYYMTIPITLTLLFIAPFIIEFWVDGLVESPFLLRFSMTLYFSLAMFGSIFVAVINGFGIIKIQMYFSIANVFVNIPLSILFAEYLSMGMSGIILASAICLSYGPFVAPFHVRKILRSKLV